MSNYGLVFFSKRNDDGSIQYSSRIHSLGTGSQVRGKIFKGELAFVQAVSSLKHKAGGVSNVISLLKAISSFHVASLLLRYFVAHSSAGWVLRLANIGPLLGAQLLGNPLPIGRNSCFFVRNRLVLTNRRLHPKRI